MFKYDLPCLNPRRLLQIPILSFVCLEMLSRMILSISFPGTEVRLTGLWFRRPSFFLSLKIRVIFSVFQPPGTSASRHDLSKIIKSGLAMTSASSQHSVQPVRPHGTWNHKLFRLENPSKTITSNRSPNTAKATAEPCPQVPLLHIF